MFEVQIEGPFDLNKRANSRVAHITQKIKQNLTKDMRDTLRSKYITQ